MEGSQSGTTFFLASAHLSDPGAGYAVNDTVTLTGGGGGAVHTFPTTTEFTAFASAAADYVFALDQVAMGTSTSLPTAAATIA